MREDPKIDQVGSKDEVPPVRIGPRQAGTLALLGVLLLMGFSLAAGLWTSSPALSFLAGATAVSLTGLLVRQVILLMAPARQHHGRGRQLHEAEERQEA